MPHRAARIVGLLCPWHLIKCGRCPPGSNTGIISHSTLSYLGGKLSLRITLSYPRDPQVNSVQVIRLNPDCNHIHVSDLGNPA